MGEIEKANPRATRAAWVMMTVGALVLVWSLAAGANGDTALVPLGIKLITPQSFLSDSPGSVRVIVTDHAERRPAAGAIVSLRLTNQEGTQGTSLFDGRTDATGTVNAAFKLPALTPGEYVLRAEARHGTQRDELSRSVKVREDYQVILVTDKPLYQPSQVIHLRALVLRRPDLRPVAEREALLEVRDGKGNKVFKRKLKTSSLGTVWADFELADQVNLGRYECRASFGESTATRTVEVKRYVLPKFRVTLDSDRPYYLPSATIKGKVTAEYFFGKPVVGGKVEIIAKTFDVEYKQIGHVEGRTDDKGVFDFELGLPRHFVGQPLEQGQAFVELHATVTDTAEHAEKVVISRTVTGQDLQIHAVPESGELVPGVPNTVWVLVSEPSGKPVRARVALRDVQAQQPWRVKGERQTVVTDDLGIAEIVLMPEFAGEPPMTGPGGASWLRGGVAVPDMPMAIEQPQARASLGTSGPIVLSLAAQSASGQSARAEVRLGVDQTTDGESLLLRTDKAVARVGESLGVVALAPVQRGYVYFDLIKDRQTMLTRSAELVEGRAEGTITLGPELAGSVFVSAYRIARSGEIVRDTQPLVVEPASDLHIDVRANKDVYRPGEPARLDFEVQRADGRPAVAALGVSIVDESVFALQDMQPGMERVYAYLEEELRKPRYEIHGLEMPVIITRPEPLVPMDKQRAARVMLASAEIPKLDMQVEDSYVARLQQAKAEWAKKMEPKWTIIQRAVQAYNRRKGKPPTYKEGLQALVREGLLKEDDLKDLWDHPLQAVPEWPGEERMYGLILVSAGPDKEFGTEDDVPVGVERRTMFGVPGMRGPGELARQMAVPAAPVGTAAEGGAGMAQSKAVAGTEPVRVRQFFPETLLFRPDLITDEKGLASIEFNMADSITTWRMTTLANSASGELGSRDAPLRCFQDFFVDLDLPVSLTQGDQVSVPVAVYNYLKTSQTVRLRLEKSGWFELMGESEQSLNLKPNDVTVRYFAIKVKGLGEHKLTVYADGSQMSDAIKRSVRVEPDGRPVEETANGRLSEEATATLTIPVEAIPGASVLLVKVYPGIFSQAVEGLDSVLQMPFGCFEQTTSTTYPNVLVLDYMRTTQQITPEVQMKAEGYINLGYQRLVSYEVAGGGFSWFGDEPANQLLTALGLMEFYDMSRVYSVDEDLIHRTQQWLLSRQEGDGSWSPDKAYLHQEAWGRLQNSKLLPTAYITYALASCEESSPKTRKGWEYVRSHWKDATDSYQLAVVCNALVAGDNLFNKGDLDDATIGALDKLVGLSKTKGEQRWWESEITGFTHSSGHSADLEATGFAALALINAGRYASEATQVLNYLIAAKDPRGTWHSTQATMLALKALLLAQKGVASKATGEVEVRINDRIAAELQITPDNADVLQMVDCRQFVRSGANDIKLTMKGQGSMLYQVVAKYWMPWKLVEKPRAELLDITLNYDKTKLAVNDMVKATVKVKNAAPGATSMVVMDLPLPPGFSVEEGDLAELVDQKIIDRFELTGRQIIVYVERIEAGKELIMTYRLRARYPIRAKAPASTAYEYYNPGNRSQTRPVEMVVTD